MDPATSPLPRFSFANSFAKLPARCFAEVTPTPVSAPVLRHLNIPLAIHLGLDPEALASPAGVDVLAGNRIPEGATPLAQAYAGHQFGGFVPRLGDGRAVLLGEVIDVAGQRCDIQLKGAGRTPFSRGGDGRAALGPVLREYLVSEAMHVLGVPTTRALAAVTTGDWVIRERPLPGAILTRVAKSHLRIGTLEYFAARDDREALTLLVQYIIDRHHPGADGPLGLLAAVVAVQARLVAHWLAIGFIHGVMNTDNTSLSGETIDYGPCAFLDGYHPTTVFSSIDEYGRYAYANQPRIMLWNLAQLANALLPLLDPNEDAAIAIATPVLDRYAALHEAEYLQRFRAKLGLATEQTEDVGLIQDLLQCMADQRADFTRVFRGLADDTASEEFADSRAFSAWNDRWHARLAAPGEDPTTRAARMNAVNPAIIPRNHRIEQAIQAATAGDFAPFERLHHALHHPYADQPEYADLKAAPKPEEVVQATFCGT